MRSETVTTIVDARPHEVFDYISDIENLPKWATEFARQLKRDGDDYKVVNGLGEFFFEIRADERTGVIDMLAGPEADELALFPTRVVALGRDHSAFTFTMFQGPGQSDELFESQYASLLREFVNIERALNT